jgi:hypothetical protein
MGVYRDGIDCLDNTRHIAGSPWNVNPESFGKSAATTFCIALTKCAFMAAPFQPDGCFYMDNEGAVFSISTFIQLNKLPDHARLEAVIIEEVRENVS